MSYAYNFAYGSNMSEVRLRARLPNVKRICVATLTGFKLTFNKQGADNSGKCDAFFTNDHRDTIYGVIYQLTEAEKTKLDQIEGPHYGQKSARAVSLMGEEISVYCYVANLTDEVLLPYDWYKQHVLHGAIQAQLPEFYLNKIASQASKTDLDAQRARREFALYKQK